MLWQSPFATIREIVMSEAAHSSTYMTRSSVEVMHPSGWALFPTEMSPAPALLPAPRWVEVDGTTQQTVSCRSYWEHALHARACDDAAHRIEKVLW